MNIYVNGQQRQVEPASRLSTVLDLPDGTPAPRGIAVALDGTVVPRTQLALTALQEGSRVEIVTAVQGG